MRLSRRDFLRLLGAGSVVGASGMAIAPAEARASVRTNARIVIAGGGAAGITAAAKLSRWLDGARITVIDARERHWYQPGFTLVGAGIYDGPEDVTSRTSDFIPRGVTWVRAMVSEFDPEANAVYTDSGERFVYDYLIVAAGIHLDYEAIEGMERGLVGQEGIGSNYESPEGAAATWRQVQTYMERGGVALFTKPDTPLKCAGAPLKAAFLTEARMREAGTRARGEFHYLADGGRLFGVDVYHDLAAMRFEEKDVHVDYFHVLQAIDPGRREATFRTQEGSTATYDYDYIHVVPPQHAVDSVRHSDLAWREGPFAAGGWLEVDRHTLQHLRYPNVFGAGDVIGTPVGKTAASVKAQVPVAAGNLVSMIENDALEDRYNGYTSCPLITDMGRAALVEFDYDMQLTPTFPFLDPEVERWIWWRLKVNLLRPYYYQMLKGRIPG